MEVMCDSEDTTPHGRAEAWHDALTARCAAGSKLKFAPMNSRPWSGGRFCAIEAWIARFDRPVSYSITGIAEWVGTVIGPQRASSGATLGSCRIAFRSRC